MMRKEYLKIAHKAYCEGRINADTYDAALKLAEEFTEDEYQGVRLDGYTNTWSAFDKLITDDDIYYIFENDVWGDETWYVVTRQKNLEPICETYDDIETALKDEGII